MTFSAEIKENLSKTMNFQPEILEAELIGYQMCANMLETEEFYEFVTENEFNIEHLYKILFQLKIDYEPEIRGKCYMAQIQKSALEAATKQVQNVKEQMRKYVIKGAFLGAGSVNNPEKNYHLEIIFHRDEDAAQCQKIAEDFGIHFKKIKVNEKYQLYLKESEEISKFLALIGANQAVLKFEEVRVMKEMKNHVNRKVNCETANLSKTVDAALRQIEDIHLLQQKKQFEKLPKELKEIAVLRLENPDLSLKDLSELVESPIGKSGVNRRLKKIHEWAEEWKG